MNRNANRTRYVSLALATALATTALGGCATQGPRADLAASKAQTALAKGKTDVAISNAEAAVMADPRNAAYRAMLGAAYMEAGRFQSAATSFDDAMKLGDNSPRTALSYALAKTAMGDNATAIAVLNDWRDEIAPADLGLALALAGDADRGVQILSNTLRSGENTPKVRQNLAYAFALKGDWRSARIMAAEDVSPAQVDERLGQWASRAAPENFQQRVAGLLSVPLRGDSGQPAQLALANFPSAEQLASEASALVPLAQAEQATEQAGGELPALAYRDEPVAVVATPAQDEDGVKAVPAVNIAAYQAPQTAEPASFEEAFHAPAPTGNTPVALAADTVRFTAKPVVQTTPARYGAVPATASRAQPRASGRVADAGSPVAQANGSHLIQLGSFASEQGARRAWGIYAAKWPELTDYQMVITEAKVRGKTYYRVSAGGFQQASAASMCGKLKARSQGCIAWADGKPLPGAVDTGYRMASR
ncbi:MAG: SPOR domain-containing protein [Sphingomonadales bacterium]|nr:SPOR domain-containing protein [Sphingomonadales bacterium]MBD3773951.1 SPOR domain-containing protein [Paracoccaceae bacterium]